MPFFMLNYKYHKTNPEKIMKKLKDFFYDKNDILVALVVLAVAALIVTWRVNVIMDYPSTLVAEAGEHGSESEDGPVIGLPPETTGSAVTSGEAIDNPIDSGADEVDICAVYVNYGEALEVVGANCVTAGLVGSVDEFMTLVNERGAASSIQAGQHYIPSNVTPDELIDYLLQPGM